VKKLRQNSLLSGGNVHDAPQGRLLMDTVGKLKNVTPVLMDRAYQDDYTQYAAQMLKFQPVVPPKKNRLNPWEYDKELYKKRNEAERLFRNIKAFRRAFTRYDKLDKMFYGFVCLALVFMAIR
jgi:transposase